MWFSLCHKGDLYSASATKKAKVNYAQSQNNNNPSANMK